MTMAPLLMYSAVIILAQPTATAAASSTSWHSHVSAVDLGPSCLDRRMADTALHLALHVIPELPFRPFQTKGFLAPVEAARALRL